MNLYAVNFDGADSAKLTAFWSAVIGGAVDDGATQEFAAIDLQEPVNRRPHLVFVHAPDTMRARNRVHPDPIADDLAGEVGRPVALGEVRKADFDEGGARWTTLRHPEGE